MSSKEYVFCQAMEEYKSSKKKLYQLMINFETKNLEALQTQVNLVLDELSKWRVGKQLSSEYYAALDEYNDYQTFVGLSLIQKIVPLRQENGKDLIIRGIYEHIDLLTQSKEVVDDLLDQIDNLRKSETFKSAEACRLGMDTRF